MQNSACPRNCRRNWFLNTFKLPQRSCAILAAAEYEAARRLGHQVKVTGKPYGFPGLAQIGRAIECAASERAAPELDSRIQRLEVCLNSIELALERG